MVTQGLLFVNIKSVSLFNVNLVFIPGKLPALQQSGNQGLETIESKLWRLLQLLQCLLGLVAEQLGYWS